MNKIYLVTVDPDFRWSSAQVAGRGFTKRFVTEINEADMNEEIYFSPLLVVEEKVEEEVEVKVEVKVEDEDKVEPEPELESEPEPFFPLPEPESESEPEPEPLPLPEPEPKVGRKKK